MIDNKIAQIKTLPVGGPNGPATAMMIAVNIVAPAAADTFVEEVAEQFKLHRTTAPPNTTMLLITLMGDMTAPRFAARWREIEQHDQIVRAYMKLMLKADVVQGTVSGQQLSAASLLAH